MLIVCMYRVGLLFCFGGVICLCCVWLWCCVFVVAMCVWFVVRVVVCLFVVDDWLMYLFVCVCCGGICVGLCVVCFLLMLFMIFLC